MKHVKKINNQESAKKSDSKARKTLSAQGKKGASVCVEITRI